VGIAADLSRTVNAFYEGCQLPHECSVNQLTFFYRRGCLQKLLVSLSVAGFILLMPTKQINLRGIRMSNSEHIMGVTWLRTPGENIEEKIIRALAKSHLSGQVTEKMG
jgi:hypothetical protein